MCSMTSRLASPRKPATSGQHGVGLSWRAVEQQEQADDHGHHPAAVGVVEASDLGGHVGQRRQVEIGGGHGVVSFAQAHRPGG
jgi:hypothetical protein